MIYRIIALRRSLRYAIIMDWLPECPHCKYDMTATESKICAECGYEQGPLRKNLWLSQND